MKRSTTRFSTALGRRPASRNSLACGLARSDSVVAYGLRGWSRPGRVRAICGSVAASARNPVLGPSPEVKDRGTTGNPPQMLIENRPSILDVLQPTSLATSRVRSNVRALMHRYERPGKVPPEATAARSVENLDPVSHGGHAVTVAP
jgi:hypothetical protein